MSRFIKILNNFDPQNGWFIQGDGDRINLADAIRLQGEADTTSASRTGRLYRNVWIGSVPGNTTYDFILEIPVGYEAWGVVREQSVGPGRLNIEFRVGGEWDSLADSVPGYNMDEVAGDESQSVFARAVGLTGSSRRAGGFQINPEPASGRTASTQTTAGTHPRFRSDTTPVFRYQNPTGSSVELALNLIWEERPIND